MIETRLYDFALSTDVSTQVSVTDQPTLCSSRRCMEKMERKNRVIRKLRALGPAFDYFSLPIVPFVGKNSRRCCIFMITDILKAFYFVTYGSDFIISCCWSFS